MEQTDGEQMLTICTVGWQNNAEKGRPSIGGLHRLHHKPLYQVSVTCLKAIEKLPRKNNWKRIQVVKINKTEVSECSTPQSCSVTLHLMLYGELSFLCINSAVSGGVFQSFWRGAVWPHCGERVLHRERRKHPDTAGLGCCVLPPQDGYCSQRSEGILIDSFIKTGIHYAIRIYWNNMMLCNLGGFVGLS